MCVACQIAKIVVCKIIKILNSKYYELEQVVTLMHVLKMCFKVINCSIFASLLLGTELFGNNYVKHKTQLMKIINDKIRVTKKGKMKINKQNNFTISISHTYCKKILKK